MKTDTVPAVELGVLASGLDATVESINFTPFKTVISGPRQMLSGVDYWRLMLIVVDIDDPDCLVIAGYVDALTVNPERPDLNDRLRLAISQLNYPEKAGAYSSLTADSQQLAATLGNAGTHPNPDLMILVLDVFIDPCFRGHNFGTALIAELRSFSDSLADMNNFQRPVFVGHFNKGTPAQVVQRWKANLHSVLSDQALLIWPSHAVLPSAEDIIAVSRCQGDIKVDTNNLRTRYANGDDTLMPDSDGRNPEGYSGTTAEAINKIVAVQALDASEIALKAITSSVNPDAEIVTALRFRTCTGCDGTESSEPFAQAGQFLHAHPTVSVISTNWSSTQCGRSVGRCLTLELVVRQMH